MKPEIKAQVIKKLIINVNQAGLQPGAGIEQSDGAATNRGTASDAAPFSDQPISGKVKKHERSLSTPMELKPKPDTGKSGAEEMAATELAKNDVTATILEELSRNLINKSDYVEALELLRKVLPMRRHNQLMARLMMVECHIHLNRSRIDIVNYIQGIKEWLMTSSDVKYEELQTLADSYQDANPIRALILRYCMDGLGIRLLPPDDAVEEIWEECLYKTSKIITSLSTCGDHLRGIALETGIPLMVRMLDNLRAVPGTDRNKTTRLEAMCLSDIGESYRSVGEIRKAIGCYTQGLEVMKRQFEDKASENKVFGDLEQNLASANQDLDDQVD